MVVEITASGWEENATDFRGLYVDERKDFRSGAGAAVIGEIGLGSTPKRLGRDVGMARESCCLFWPAIGVVMLVADGTVVTSLSFVMPGRCAEVGNLRAEAGGRKGEVQVGLGSTTVSPVWVVVVGFA